MENNKFIITSDDNNLIVTTLPKVVIRSTIEIIGTNTELPITITADFNNIPKELHYQYYQALTYQYHKDVKVHSNIDDEPVKPDVVKPWYKRLFN